MFELAAWAGNLINSEVFGMLSLIALKLTVLLVLLRSCVRNIMTARRKARAKRARSRDDRFIIRGIWY